MREPNRVISLMLVLGAFAISAVAFPHLPAQVPTHWGLSGQPDHFGGRVQGAFIIPALMFGIWLVLTFVPNYDRVLFIRYDRSDSDSSTVRPEYDRLVAIVLAVMLGIHTFAIASALGLVGSSRQPIVIAVIVSLGTIAIGNYLPRVTRRNAFIGVRLPWAYASEEVWRRTQRAGGYGMVAAGVVGLVGTVAVPSAPLKPLFAALLTQLIIVACYSYYLAHSRTVS